MEVDEYISEWLRWMIHKIMEVDEYISEWLRWMIHKIMEVIREHMGQVCKSQLQTGTNWHLPGTLASKGTTKTWAFAICLCCCICWPSTPPAGNSGYRVRHPVLQRNWWNRSLERYFGELILGSQSLYLLVSRKALNPSWKTAPQVALRNCSKAAVEESQYIRFWWRGVQCNEVLSSS